MERSGTPNRTVKTAQTVFDIIEALRALDGAGVTDLADHLGLAPSTVHDHVTTLESMEYVRKDGDEYALSLKFLDHGTWIKQTYDTISDLSKPVLDGLAAETGESTWLIVEEHGRAIYLEKAMGEHAVQTNVRIGMREDIHALAAGKAILAHMPETAVEAVVDRRGLAARTEHTITDCEALYEELETIRERGYATMDGELLEGLRAVGSAITYSDRVLGAVAVAGPSTRIDDELFRDDIPEAVTAAANEIELKAEYSRELPG